MQTIRFRIVLAFGACVVLMIVIGTLGASRLMELSANATSSNHTRVVALLTTTLIGVVVAIYGGFYMHRLVCGAFRRQFIKFSEIAETLDFSKRAAAPKIKEFRLAANAFDKFMGRLEETIVAVHLSTELIATATREIAAGNMDLSVRTEGLAISLEKTTSSVTQITEAARQSTDSVRQVSGLATQASDMASAGSHAVEKMVVAIDEMSRSSLKVVEIIGLIENIAFQTNILALNAAVEAARVGEHGRGFAVVASEVRDLAQRSSVAARETRQLIESSVASVQNGTKQARDVGNTISEVKQAITRVSDIVSKIAAGSEDQSRGIEQINRSIIQIDDVTQQNASLVEQAAAATKSLEEQAVQLRLIVSQFKVASTGPTPQPMLVPGR